MWVVAADLFSDPGPVGSICLNGGTCNIYGGYRYAIHALCQIILVVTNSTCIVCSITSHAHHYQLDACSLLYSSHPAVQFQNKP